MVPSKARAGVSRRPGQGNPSRGDRQDGDGPQIPQFRGEPWQLGAVRRRHGHVRQFPEDRPLPFGDAFAVVADQGKTQFEPKAVADPGAMGVALFGTELSQPGQSPQHPQQITRFVRRAVLANESRGGLRHRPLSVVDEALLARRLPRAPEISVLVRHGRHPRKVRERRLELASKRCPVPRIRSTCACRRVWANGHPTRRQAADLVGSSKIGIAHDDRVSFVHRLALCAGPREALTVGAFALVVTALNPIPGWHVGTRCLGCNRRPAVAP